MPSATVSKETFQPDSGIHITLEDQQKINQFARLNARVKECKEKYSDKMVTLRSIRCAFQELSFFDEEDYPNLPFLAGKTFANYNLETIQNHLEGLKKDIVKELIDISSIHRNTLPIMEDLKTYLFGKFGNNINLEAEDFEN